MHPYTDLILGRVDAVLLDYVLAERGVRRNPGLMNQPTEVGTGYYVGITAPEKAALRDRMNEILLQAMKDGRLEAIFRRWNMWNDDQPRFYARLLSGERIPQSAEQPPTQAPTGMGCGRPISSSPRACGCGHLCAVVSVDGARCSGRSADRKRQSIRALSGSHAFDRVGRTGSRHAAAVAALRSLFRLWRSSSSCLRSSPRSSASD